MSFSRLVFVLLTLLLLVLLTASFTLSVVHSRHYLSRQLAVHAQDTATALGLSLAPALRQGDRVAIDSLVKAVGDGGYFHSIRVVGTDGVVLAEQASTLDVAGVPAWFVRWLTLQTPTRSALIMDGWREVGHVEISSHPGYAYQQLWDDARDLLLWFSIAGGIALAILMSLARSALRPLVSMERQAQAIGTGHFVALASLPWARELRQVAMAMNQMAGKVDAMLSDKIKTIEKLEIASNRDALTGLNTRNFLNDHIGLLMSGADECESAALLLIRFPDLADVNTQWGYAEGSDLLIQFATLLHDQARKLQEAIAARSGGAEFMLLVREISPEETLALANTLLLQLRALASPHGGFLGAAHIGIGFRDADMTDPSKLFAQADMALRSAESRGRYWAFMYPPSAISPEMTFGASRWRRMIEHALTKHTLVLFEQAVFHTLSREPLHYELLPRIQDEDGHLIGAATFLPMAHRLELSSAIDRAVVELALTQNFSNQTPRVLNLSLDSIQDEEFANWLLQRLRTSNVEVNRILVELPERAAAEAPACVSRLISSLASMGIRFGFNHVGLVPEALASIRHLRPIFLKCDETLLSGMDAGSPKRSLVEMLMELACALDSVFIVAGIETEEQAAVFRAMGVGALQGRAFDVPKALHTL